MEIWKYEGNREIKYDANNWTLKEIPNLDNEEIKVVQHYKREICIKLEKISNLMSFIKNEEVNWIRLEHFLQNKYQCKNYKKIEDQYINFVNDDVEIWEKSAVVFNQLNSMDLLTINFIKSLTLICIDEPNEINDLVKKQVLVSQINTFGQVLKHLFFLFKEVNMYQDNLSDLSFNNFLKFEKLFHSNVDPQKKTEAEIKDAKKDIKTQSKIVKKNFLELVSDSKKFNLLCNQFEDVRDVMNHSLNFENQKGKNELFLSSGTWGVLFDFQTLPEEFTSHFKNNIGSIYLMKIGDKKSMSSFIKNNKDNFNNLSYKIPVEETKIFNVYEAASDICSIFIEWIENFQKTLFYYNLNLSIPFIS